MIIIIVITVTIVLAISAITVFSYEGAFKTNTTPSTGKIDRFTIIESDPPNSLAGMNGSYYKGAATTWPIIKVHVGDTVIITIFNNGSSEPHGFGIDHYEPAPGLTISAGQTQTLTFVADQTGTFRIYCTIECSIHPLMQNGELVVS